MLIKTILNAIEKFKAFVYGKAFWEVIAGEQSLVIKLSPRRNSQGECYICSRRCSTYDTQPLRDYEYVPLWGIRVYFRYAPRRVSCQKHGFHVERVPWAEGKERLTKSYQSFLARWAKRLSWKEVAEAFKTSWESVYRSVKWVVDYGLANRDWDDVEQIGVDELAVFKGHKYLTCVYQLDKGRRRLLWCGMDRRVKTLLRFFREFGKEHCLKLRFVCSDMWKPYLKVIKKIVIGIFNKIGIPSIEPINQMPFVVHTASHENAKLLKENGLGIYTPEIKLGFHNDGLLRDEKIEIPKHIVVYNLYINYRRPGNFIWVPTKFWKEADKYEKLAKSNNIKVKIRLTPSYYLDQSMGIKNSLVDIVEVPISHVNKNGENRFFLNGQVLPEDNPQINVNFVQSMRDSLHNNPEKICIHQKERHAFFLKNTMGFHARDVFQDPIEGINLTRVFIRAVDVNTEEYLTY